MRFDVITIFPKMFDCFLNESLIKRALKRRLIDIRVHNLRHYTTDKHHTVDDRPYGGGPGMILKIEPISRALTHILGVSKMKKASRKNVRVIMLDPAGKQFDQVTAKQLSKYKQLVFLSGRYEGFDARVRQLIDERISIGPYVLSGGELPAMVIIEAISRYQPGVIGHEQALQEETNIKKGYFEYPQYTRPEIFRTPVGKAWRVPKVLLSGNHKKITEWRRQKSE